MTQETKLNINEILTKLAKLQTDVDYLKSRMEPEDKKLEAEMKSWEEASVEDASDFFEKHNL